MCQSSVFHNSQYFLCFCFLSSTWAFSSSSSTSSQPSCLPHSINPIAIPIQNVTVNANASNVRRGAAISIGTPPQLLAFNPVNQLNATHIYDLNNPCDMRSKSILVNLNATTAQCFASYGGVFDEGTSKTWQTATSASEIGISDDPLLNASVLYGPYYGNTSYGSDTFTLSTDISMENQAFVIWHGSSDTEEIPWEPYLMNSIGLGTNSSLLNALFTAENISARIWSYWEGWTGADKQNQSDGSLVLGGYDAALTTGDNITLKFTTDQVDLYENDCNLIVTVRDINVKYTNGTTSSILGKSKAKTLRYCIIPSFPGISLTNDPWIAFYNMTGTQYLGNGQQRSVSHLSYWNNIVSAESAFDGDLIISVDPGLDITIPNHELVKPYVDIDPAGQEYITNSSSVRLLALSSLDAIQTNQLPVLGRPFFSSAYLMVDNDRQQATLWQAQPAQKQDLRALGPPQCSPAIGTSSNTPGTPTTPTPVTTSPPSKAPSKGAVTGIAVGAASIVSFFFLIGYIFAKKRSKPRSSDVPFDPSSLEPEKPIYEKPELPSSKPPPPQEMAHFNFDHEVLHELNGMTDRSEDIKCGYPAAEMPADLGHDITAIEMPSRDSNASSVSKRPSRYETQNRLPSLPDSPMSYAPNTPMSMIRKVLTISKRKPLPITKGVPSQEALGDRRSWL